MGFLPLGFTTLRFHEAGFGLAWLGGAVATGTVMPRRRLVGRLAARLPLERRVKQFVGENLPQRDDEVFEFGEGGAPGGTVGSPDAIGEVFCDPFEIGSNGVGRR